MDIRNLGYLHWILIGASVGSALAWLWTTTTVDFDDIPTTDLSTFEKEVVQTDERTGDPLIIGIVIHPAQYSPADEGNVNVVTYKRLIINKFGERAWSKKRVVAQIPHVPTLRSNRPAMADLTIERYLADIATKYDFVTFSSAWWMKPKNAVVLGASSGALIIGLIWPAILELMIGSRIGMRQPRSRIPWFSWKLNTVRGSRERESGSSSTDLALVEAVVEIYEDRMLPGNAADATPNSLIEINTPKVRELQRTQLEEAKTGRNANADDEIEVKGEYYPVLIPHKRSHVSDKDGSEAAHTPKEDQAGK